MGSRAGVRCGEERDIVILGGAMADHIHEWNLVDPDDREKSRAECFWRWEESGYKIQCPAILYEVEINRRLNAIDKLSAHLKDTLDRAEGNPTEYPECEGEEAWWKQRTRMALVALEEK